MAIGSDPEFFLKSPDKDRNWEFLSCSGLLKGANKGKPLPIAELFAQDKEWDLDEVYMTWPFLSPTSTVQEDNVMLEMNSTPKDQASHVLSEIEDMKRLVGEYLGTPRKPVLTMSESVVEVPDYVLEDKKALEFGCDPDSNIYTGMSNPTYGPQDLGNKRFAGGHIHLSFDRNKLNPMDSVAFMDCLVGLPLTMVEKFRRFNMERHYFYGQAGNYRDKEYGVEYRTPSNIWCHRQPREPQRVFATNVGTVNLLATGMPKYVSDFLGKAPVMGVAEAINNPVETSLEDMLKLYNNLVGLYNKDRLNEVAPLWQPPRNMGGEDERPRPGLFVEEDAGQRVRMVIDDLGRG